LIIKGILTSDTSATEELSPEMEAVQKALEEMKKELKKYYLEMVTPKLEVKNGD
tara:strand:+ start:50 stop:211 length:162 start_codon:yes stop_codon:yes gene_type:complete